MQLASPGHSDYGPNKRPTEIGDSHHDPGDVSAGSSSVQSEQAGGSVAARAKNREPGFLTIREAASLLRVSESTIRNAVRNGQLRAFRFGNRGGSIRIAADDFQQYVTSCETPGPRRTAKGAGSGNGLFKALDGRKLLAAWQRQGVLDGPPSDSSAPSSGSRYVP